MRKKNEPKWTPREVDSFLQKKYALSLYHFTFSLDDVFSIRNKRAIKVKESQHLELSWRDFWLERIKDLEKLKQYNKENRKILNKQSKRLFPFILSPKTLPYSGLRKFLSPFEAGIKVKGRKIRW